MVRDVSPQGSAECLPLREEAGSERCFSLFVLCSHQGKLPLLLSRMNEVAKVFLATNSDYKYTDVSKKPAPLRLNKAEFDLT